MAPNSPGLVDLDAVQGVNAEEAEALLHHGAGRGAQQQARLQDCLVLGVQHEALGNERGALHAQIVQVTCWGGVEEYKGEKKSMSLRGTRTSQEVCLRSTQTCSLFPRRGEGLLSFVYACVHNTPKTVYII